MSTRFPRNLLTGLLSIFVVFFAVAFSTEFFDISYLPPDVQNKCTQSKPRQTSRPTSGVVKIIRLTNQGEFADRCELTDALFEIAWNNKDHWCIDQPGQHTCLNVRADATVKPK